VWGGCGNVRVCMCRVGVSVGVGMDECGCGVGVTVGVSKDEVVCLQAHISHTGSKHVG
jgi:hypothetical protein